MSVSSSLWRLRFKRRWKHILGITLLSTVLAVICQERDFLEMGDSERGAYDSGLKAFTWVSKPDSQRSTLEKLFAFAKKRPEKSTDVVVVAIDDTTIYDVARDEFLRSQYGAWPYSRNVWAHLILRLHKLGAKAIVLDATMDEAHPDASGDKALADAVASGVPFYVGVNASAVDPKNSEHLFALPAVEATNRFPGVVDAGTAEVKITEEDPFGESAEAQQAVAQTRLTPEDIAKALAFPVEARGGLELPLLEASPQEQSVGAATMKALIPPLEPLLRVGPGFGLVVTEADEDGKLRRTSFAYSDGKNSYVSLSPAVVADVLGAEKITIEPGRLTIGTKAYAINRAGDAEIRYGGTLTDRFEIIPMNLLLRDYWEEELAKDPSKKITPTNRIVKERIAGKVVVIGGFATGTADSKPTPLEAGTPAVVKHAAEIDSLMGGRFITEAHYAVSLMLTLFIAFISAVIILLVRSTVLELVWPVALYFGFFLVTGAFLVYTDTHVLSAMPSLAGSLASVIATAINHFWSDKQLKQLEETRDMMSRYMEPSLVDSMMATGQQPQLGGENREITAFFSDIRGFSGFSEMWKDDPQQLVKFLNEYLTRVSAVLQKHQGCVDKYIGDAVVCLFGAPFPDQEHAKHACEGALAVRDEIARMREQFRKQGLPDVYTRIGLNSGVMLVGNIGSAQMYDYTAMGDAMNLAARLEGANKNYESTIMIGERTYQLAKDFIEVRELDRVRVAGKKDPATVYELLAMKGGIDQTRRNVVQLYEQALGLYRAAHFVEAGAALNRALSIDPEDGPSKMLARRVQKYVEQPPPLPFDGIANLEK